MISRLSAIAVSLAIFTTATLAFAGSIHQAPAAAPAVAKAVHMVELERVTIVGKRLAQEPR